MRCSGCAAAIPVVAGQMLMVGALGVAAAAVGAGSDDSGAGRGVQKRVQDAMTAYLPRVRAQAASACWQPDPSSPPHPPARTPRTHPRPQAFASIGYLDPAWVHGVLPGVLRLVARGRGEEAVYELLRVLQPPVNDRLQTDAAGATNGLCAGSRAAAIGDSARRSTRTARAVHCAHSALHACANA